MSVTTLTFESKSVNVPDEVRTFPRGRVEIVRIGSQVLMRATFEPGWRWSEHVKPKAGTDYCEVEHVGYLVSGRLATRMRDGRQQIFEPGDFATIPPGHDGWVVGNDPAVFIDYVGGERYAR